MTVELIDELKNIRVRLTQIYMELDNPADCEADMLLSKDIEIFEKRALKDFKENNG